MRLADAALPRYTALMTPTRLLLLALACTWAATAAAQYQWVDKDGRKVFSDRPPPVDVPQKNILKEPRALTPIPARVPAATAAATTTGEAQAASTAAAGADGAQPAAAGEAGQAKASGTDKSLQDAKAKAEEEEKAKKKAEEEAKAKKEAQARADNCQRARQAKTALEPGRLVATTNAQGERVFMDDDKRAAELQRAEKIIQTDCK